MSARLRVLIADDERPARSLMQALLSGYQDVDLVAECSDGAEALERIETLGPDLALLDLQMPEIDGLEVVRLLPRNCQTLIAFVTAWDDRAVEAFELNAVDYLLKPVDPVRLRETITRAQERAETRELRERSTDSVRHVAEQLGTGADAALRWIPVRRRNDTFLLPVERLASVVAEGELLHLYTAEREKHTITYRLKDLESRLHGGEWIRLGRGTLARIAMIDSIAPLTGGTYLARLRNGQELSVSRLQSRLLRERLLRI